MFVLRTISTSTRAHCLFQRRVNVSEILISRKQRIGRRGTRRWGNGASVIGEATRCILRKLLTDSSIRGTIVVRSKARGTPTFLQTTSSPAGEVEEARRRVKIEQRRLDTSNEAARAEIPFDFRTMTTSRSSSPIASIKSTIFWLFVHRGI